jgi:peroxiredoxin
VWKSVAGTTTGQSGKLQIMRVITGVVLIFFLGATLLAQKQEIVWSDQEKPIVEQLHNIRNLPDNVRVGVTKDLALRIRQLPVVPNKLRLAMGLAGRATEGDFGHDTLQEVATTLADAIREQPPKEQDAYLELASLVRYEHVSAALDSRQYAAAMAKLEADDQHRNEANFTLTDLSGKSWTLKDLRGKVVLVNFWATWCPPCRKEMPDLEILKQRFGPQGLVILGISDEDAATVQPFVTQQKVTYPILLDSGRKVNGLFQIDGIPKTFIYDREGEIVAQSIDMRTQKQFLEMLAKAGLQ